MVRDVAEDVQDGAVVTVVVEPQVYASGCLKMFAMKSLSASRWRLRFRLSSAHQSLP